MKRSGFKSKGKPLKAKKPMRKRSPKRAAYMASQERQDGLEHMAKVKSLPCCICGAPPPSEAHHVTGDKKPRNDMRTIPLCLLDHRGPNGYHARKKTWVARNGPDYSYLQGVIDAVGSGEL